MKSADIDINLIESYFGLLKNLSPDSKLELIARLSKSMKTTKKAKTDSIKSLFGAFISEQSADELIDDIRKARTFKETQYLTGVWQKSRFSD